MNKIVKYTLILFGLNLALGLLLFLPLIIVKDNDTLIGYSIFLLLFAFFSLLIQLIIGIIFAAGQTRKDFGKAMLITVGIFLIIGAGVCGGSYAGLF